VSERSGNGNSNFFANAAFFSTESKETPRISVFFFWNSVYRSRNPQPSIVQPGVSAFG
jgi:hypothetical protein